MLSPGPLCSFPSAPAESLVCFSCGITQSNICKQHNWEISHGSQPIQQPGQYCVGQGEDKKIGHVFAISDRGRLFQRAG